MAKLETTLKTTKTFGYKKNEVTLNISVLDKDLPDLRETLLQCLADVEKEITKKV